MARTPELDTMESLAEAPASLREVWRRFSSCGGTATGFEAFIEARVGRSQLRLSEDGMELPQWRQREVVARPDTESAERVTVELTKIGRRELRG